MAGIEIAQLYATLSLRDNLTSALGGARGGLTGFGTSLTRAGANVTALGASINTIMAPLRRFGEESLEAAMGFEESMSNIGAVLGTPLDELGDLADEIREIGTASRYGPQAAAEAFYDIVGGVADASTHMAIFNTAIHTAQAGNADLTATTAALISVMNAYSYSADEAAGVSDILTQTVAMGVGSMDEFAAALPDVTGVAASAGVSLMEVASAAAYLTTQGFSASEATTRVRQSIVALLNPNEAMAALMERAGIASGSAALAQDGLAETYLRLNEAAGGSIDKMAEATGSVWALQGATAVASDDFAGFASSFRDSADGITASAEAIQLSSSAAKWDVLNSQIEDLKITIGDALLPILQDIVDAISPVVTEITNWIRENPQLASTIAMVMGGIAAFGAVLVVVGPIIGAIGALIAALSGPVLVVIGVVSALAAAIATDFLGIRTTIESVVTWFTGTAMPAIRDFVANEVQPRLEKFFQIIANAWAEIQPQLEELRRWFVEEGLPKLVGFINETARPALEGLWGVISGAWDAIQPALASILNWFTSSGLPAIIGWVKLAWDGFFIWVDIIQGAWAIISIPLQNIYDWFTGTGMPQIQGAVSTLTTLFNNLWTMIGVIANYLAPILQPVVNFFNGAFNTIRTVVIDPLIGALGDLWTAANNALLLLQVLGGGGISIPGRAIGGPVEAGRPYMVGERGPELFVPGSSGQITPNHLLSGLDSSTGGMTINVQMPASALMDEATARRRGRDFGDEIARRLRTAG